MDPIQEALRPHPGVLLILSAPSGAGKTTLARRLGAELGEDGLFSVSYTTRQPRGAERDGVDYHFVDRAAFQTMIDAGDFLEWAEVHGNFYGTHRSYAEAAAGKKAVIFDIDVQGGEQFKARHPEAVSVFILPPSMEELERRLRSRGTDSDEVIARRLAAAHREIERGMQCYDCAIVNDDLDRAYDDLSAVVRASNLRLLSR
jgi:guanylate kinase